MSSTDINLKWFVIYTKPRSEKKLLSVLQDLKVEAYLPLLRHRKKWSDRFKWVEEPIFPSYIFVNIDFQNESLRLRKLAQVVDFVRVAGQPVTISQQDITMLQYSLEKFNDSLTVVDSSSFQVGEKVTITDGPFVGREAIVQQSKNRAKVMVSFPALLKILLVEIPVEQISKQAYQA